MPFLSPTIKFRCLPTTTHSHCTQLRTIALEIWGKEKPASLQARCPRKRHKSWKSRVTIERCSPSDNTPCKIFQTKLNALANTEGLRPSPSRQLPVLEIRRWLWMLLLCPQWPVILRDWEKHLPRWGLVATHCSEIFVFGCASIWTQGLTLSRQAPYTLSHAPSPYILCLVLLW
jgi:hypothetical protein